MVTRIITLKMEKWNELLENLVTLIEGQKIKPTDVYTSNLAKFKGVSIKLQGLFILPFCEEHRYKVRYLVSMVKLPYQQKIGIGIRIEQLYCSSDEDTRSMTAAFFGMVASGIRNPLCASIPT